MITDFETLIKLCDEELRQREYTEKHYRELKSGWIELSEWMNTHKYTEFNQEIGYAYCDETFGGHLVQKDMSKKIKLKIRSVRMLISYQKDGSFEFRTPKVEYIFSGALGEMVLNYFEYCEQELQLLPKTINIKKLHLHEFITYLESRKYSINDLNMQKIENFFKLKKYLPSVRCSAGRNIKNFLRYLFDVGTTPSDYSIYVLKSNYDKKIKLQTTYTESEVKAIIESVERSSAIGKRDYLILLLSAQYGWRSSEITHFRFEHIDWDKNIIRFNQIKTGNAVEYPLLASVGNAIIDYAKNGRPLTNTPEIIVSAEKSRKGLPLSSGTLHSVITKYMRKASIQNWQNKKHGTHALRYSLATNMLRKNISMPIISTVLGHQSTESTKTYLRIDITKLRQCVLPMPPVYSKHYRSGVKL